MMEHTLEISFKEFFEKLSNNSFHKLMPLWEKTQTRSICLLALSAMHDTAK